MKKEKAAIFAAVLGISSFACPVLAQQALGMLGVGRQEEPASGSEQQQPVWHFTLEQARQIGQSLGIDWSTPPFSVKQYRVGLEVELEHGSRNPQTDVTHDDALLTGKIALAHLNENPEYYYQLALMEGNDVYLHELLGTSRP